MSEVRQFDTGATRSAIGDKLRYEGFLSPLVLKRYAEYMHRHRIQSDGALREPDNWQKGMPRNSFMDSGLRHAMEWWLHHRGYGRQTRESMEDSLCALIFNAMGYLFEILNDRDAIKEQLKVESNLSHWVATQPANTGHRPEDACDWLPD